jgi:ribokinase
VNGICADIAGRNGTKIIMNPAPRRCIPETLKKQVFLFTPNEYEAEELNGFDNCVITLGSRGSLIKRSNEFIPAEAVAAVDTTGAGDTYTGVLTVMLGEGKTLTDAARIASKAAAITVTRRGAASAIPYRQEYLG